MPLLTDLRLAFRGLRRNPAFAAGVLACLALGVGSTAAMLAVVDAVLFKPLPYPDSGRIVEVWNHLVRMDLPWMEASAPEFLDYRRGGDTPFAAVGAYVSGARTTIVAAGEPEPVVVGVASAGLFPLLGVRALHGRTFHAEEEVPGRDNVVLLTHELWTRRFGADPAVLGTTALVDGNPYTVAGVLPPGFRFPDGRVDIWLPLAFDPAELPPRGQRFVHVLARLEEGLSPAGAQAEMDVLAERMRREHTAVYERQGWRPELVPIQEHLVRRVRPALWSLLVAVLLVLLIACANAASLLLVRALAREGEMATRAALGASRPALVRQLVVEGAVLGLLGGLFGLALAGGALTLLSRMDAGILPRLEEIRLAGRPLALTLGLSLATGVLFGLAPAAHLAGRRLRLAMVQGSGGAVGERSGRLLLRRGLVVAEIALACILLIGAGLMIRSFAAAQRVDPGFDADNVLTQRIALTSASYGAPEAMTGFYRRLLERAAALPGVRGAGAVSILPLSGGEIMSSFVLEGSPVPAGRELPSADLRVATPGYFETLGIAVADGRSFRESDDATAPKVALIDRELARRYLADRRPLGRRLQLGSSGEGEWLTIVGVVEHVKQDGLDRASRGQIYLPHAQHPQSEMTVVVRTEGAPERLAGEIRGAVRALDPLLAVSDVRSMEEVLAGSLALRRLSSSLLTLFSGLALVLALVGLSSVMAYNVARRRREIALRMALGAQKRDVLRLVLREGAILAGLGLGLGLAGAAVLSRSLRSLVFGVEVLDPATYAAVALLLSLIALLATWGPARRAVRLAPAGVLRSGDR